MGARKALLSLGPHLSAFGPFRPLAAAHPGKPPLPFAVPSPRKSLPLDFMRRLPVPPPDVTPLRSPRVRPRVALSFNITVPLMCPVRI